MKKIISFILIIFSLTFLSCKNINSHDTILGQSTTAPSTSTGEISPPVPEQTNSNDNTTIHTETTTYPEEEGTYNKEYSGRY